jgi:transposase
MLKQNRILVARLASAGLTSAEINALNIPDLPKRTVYDYQKKLQIGQKFDHRSNSGRPSKINSEDLKVIRGELREKKFSSCKSLSKKLKEEKNKEVHPTTIRNTLKKHLYANKGPEIVPALTTEQKAERVLWAKEHLADNWTKTIFSDETSIWLDGAHVKRWMPAHQAYSVERRKYPPKLHVWGAISKKGIFGPTIWRENMNGELYTDILNYNWGDIEHAFRYTRGWRFQQDGDPKHRCTKAKYFFMQHKVRYSFGHLIPPI